MGKFGFNVWWYLPETVANYEKIQQLLAENGFLSEDVKMPTKRAEVSRAARSLQDRRSRDNRRVTEKAKDDDTKVVYGILDRGQEGEEVDYHQTTKVVFDKTDKRVHVSGELSEEFMMVYKSLKDKVTSSEIRSFLKLVVRMCAGIPKRPSGGIYFIPASSENVIRNAQAVIEGLNCGAKLYVERVMDGREERENLWGSVETEVTKRIEMTLASADKITSRASSLHNKAAQINQLEELVGIYEELLGDEANYELMRIRLNNATHSIEKKIAKLNHEIATTPKVKRKVNRRNKWLEFGVKVLQEAGEPMHYAKVAEAAVELGLETSSKSPEIQMGSTLSAAAKKGGIKRVRVGVYAI